MRMVEAWGDARVVGGVALFSTACVFSSFVRVKFHSDPKPAMDAADEGRRRREMTSFARAVQEEGDRALAEAMAAEEGGGVQPAAPQEETAAATIDLTEDTSAEAILADEANTDEIEVADAQPHPEAKDGHDEGAAGNADPVSDPDESRSASESAAERRRRVGTAPGRRANRGRGAAARNAQSSSEHDARRRRALAQRILFISARSTADDVDVEVLGTTGTAYHVQFHNARCRWTCSCPDFVRRGCQCKHIIFVLARVLALDVSDPSRSSPSAGIQDVSEIADVLAARQVAADFVYDPAVHSKCPSPSRPTPRPKPRRQSSKSEADGKSAEEPPGKQDEGRRRAWEAGEQCCICIEDFEADDIKNERTWFCEQTCGRSVHRLCFQRYVDLRKVAICPYCRSDMHPPGLALGGKKHRPPKRQRS